MATVAFHLRSIFANLWVLCFLRNDKHLWSSLWQGPPQKYLLHSPVFTIQQGANVNHSKHFIARYWGNPLKTYRRGIVCDIGVRESPTGAAAGEEECSALQTRTPIWDSLRTQINHHIPSASLSQQHKQTNMHHIDICTGFRNVTQPIVLSIFHWCVQWSSSQRVQ